MLSESLRECISSDRIPHHSQSRLIALFSRHSNLTSIGVYLLCQIYCNDYRNSYIHGHSHAEFKAL
jgi:hypothetical protein